MFRFIRNWQRFFQNSCTILHSHQQFISSSCFVSSVTLGMSVVITVDMKWSLIVALILISLTDNVEYLFMSLLDICISSLVYCHEAFSSFLLGLSFYYWFVISLYILWMKAVFQIYGLQIFIPSLCHANLFLNSSLLLYRH